MGGGSKKKKNVKNDFYFFMMERKKLLSDQGRNFNMKDLAEICSPDWNRLSAQDKARYKEMAKEAKEKDKNDLANKFDSTGRSILSIQNEERDKKLNWEKTLQDIKFTVEGSYRNDTFPSQKYHFIHFNILCDLEGDGISTRIKSLPCEVGMVQWSLENGITDFFHSFINPPQIPLGYSYNITRIAEETHRITLDIDPMKKNETKNYRWIVNRVIEMLNKIPSEKYFPPLYTNDCDIERVNGILDDLYDWSSLAGRQYLKVYPIQELFYTFSNPGPNVTPNQHKLRLQSSLQAQDILQKDTYNYQSNISCPFHEAEDRARFCSLLQAKRWAYLFSNYFCESYEIKPKLGYHSPPEQNDESYYENNKFHFNGCWYAPENYEGAEKPKGKRFIPSAGVSDPYPKNYGGDIRPVIEPSSMFQGCNIENNSNVSQWMFSSQPSKCQWTSMDLNNYDDSPSFSADSFPSLGGGRSKNSQVLVKKNQSRSGWTSMDLNKHDDSPSFTTDCFPSLGSGEKLDRRNNNQMPKNSNPWGIGRGHKNKPSQFPGLSRNQPSNSSNSEFPELNSLGRGINRIRMNK